MIGKRLPRPRLVRIRRGIVAASLVLLTGCASGPAYEPPRVDLPADWKSGWRPARPADALPRGEWWRVFRDSELDRLEAIALTDNQSLRIAVARLAQARALTALSRAGQGPTVEATVRATRQRTSANRPGTTSNATLVSTVQNDFIPGLAVSYEADLFGRLGHERDAASASEEQAQADVGNARLLLTAEVAATYFLLRAVDVELAVIRENIALQLRAVELLTARRTDGLASGFELAQQEAQLEATRTQLELLQRSRSQFENALATLLGVPASRFALAPQALVASVPPLPVHLPAEAIERRPDVAGAERAVAAANAQVGVASAGFFPTLRLAAAGGWESRTLENLFTTPSLVWSLGATAAVSLIDGGRNRARVALSSAGHDAATAAYRQTVLRALQEVEDALSGLSALERAATDSRSAVEHSQRVLDIASDRHRSGISSYLEVITAQQSHLANRRVASQIHGQQLLASVFLVKALGGGWEPLPAHQAFVQ